MSAASDALAAGLGALTESVHATCNDPADAIRLLYALASLAWACADFVPASYDDDASIRDDVVGVLDAEAQVAADGGDAATCLALRPADRGRRRPRQDAEAAGRGGRHRRLGVRRPAGRLVVHVVGVGLPRDVDPASGLRVSLVERDSRSHHVPPCQRRARRTRARRRARPDR